MKHFSIEYGQFQEKVHLCGNLNSNLARWQSFHETIH